MLPWQELALQLGRQNTTLGSTINVNGILQDSYTSEFIIGVEGTIGTAAATACAEGLPAIIQKVNIQGPLTGYSPLNPVNGLSGPMLVEIGQFIRRNISYSFGSLGSTGKFGVYIPCTFINPRLRYPYSHMSCLPTKFMGAVNFTMQLANQGQLDTNGTATLAFSTLTIFVQQNEYKSSSIPNMAPLAPAAQLANGGKGLFMFVPSSLNYLQNSNITTSAQTQTLLPNGTYTLILLRSFTSQSNGVPTVRQTDTGTAGPIDTSVTTSGLTLQDVNQNPKLATDWYTLRKDNEDNITDSLIAGNACFQLNNGLAAIFQPQVGPNQVPVNYGTTTSGTTNPRVDFVYQQIFDTQNWLNLI